MIKHITISNSKERILRGYADLPEKAQHIVVFFHGYTGNKTEHHGHFRTFSRLLSKNNIASLRMDYACNGESDGEFSAFRFDEALDDAKRMLQYAKKDLGFNTVSILGFSMGGLIASLVCNVQPIHKMALWSPSGGLSEKIASSFDKALKRDNGCIYTGGFEISPEWVASLQGYDPYLEASKHFSQVFIIHGTNDLAVPYEESIRYAEKFRFSEIYLMKNTGHGYDRYEERQELFEITLRFFK